MTSWAVLNRWHQTEIICYNLQIELSVLHFTNLLKTGELIHVYGWIITGTSETFDFDAEYIDR